MKRYEQQIALSEIGISGQQQLTEARVLMIGAGGLGCPVLQNLVAAGIGKIGIVDGDVIEESNLHRQFLYTSNDIGKSKAVVSAQAALNQNPDIKIVAYTEFFKEENAFEILSDYQIVVDCTDSIKTRYLINDVVLVKKIPMVYASIHKYEGQLSVFNYEAGPTYRCLFPQKGLEVDCSQAGVLGVISNMLGVLQAAEVLKIILGIGDVLSGKLLLYDGLKSAMQTITIEKNPLEIQNGLLNGIEILNRTKKQIESIDTGHFIEATADAANLIIDLRETYEEPKLNFNNIQNIPLSHLENYLENVDKTQKIILFCEYGNKSAQAADYLITKGFSNVMHLHDGIGAFQQNQS